MLGLLKTKKPHETSAQNIYAQILEHIRTPCFYTQYAVPDTMDGRFDLLVLHLFMLMEHILEQQANSAQAQDFNQALFDAAFTGIARDLRETGVGDMGIPKHMRRMMTAFNGRLHAYREAQETGAWQDALKRNLYGTAPDTENTTLEHMKNYIQKLKAGLKQDNNIADILQGRLCLKPPKTIV